MPDQQRKRHVLFSPARKSREEFNEARVVELPQRQPTVEDKKEWVEGAKMA